MNFKAGWVLGCVCWTAFAWADPTPQQLYQTMLKETPAKAEAHGTLARWCREQGLKAEALEQWKVALTLDPEWAEVREALGYRKVAGVWMSAEDRAAMEEARKKDQPADKAKHEIVEGKAIGWTDDHEQLIVQAKNKGLIDLDTRYIRVGIPLVTLELRPTMSQVKAMRTLNVISNTNAQNLFGGGNGNVFIEAPVVQMDAIRTTVQMGAYP